MHLIFVFNIIIYDICDVFLNIINTYIMNKIMNIIKSREKRCFKFHPDSSFYKEIGINRKRWGLIYRSEIEPTITEAKAIANYFEVELTELI
jgi:hypothetical protein